MRNIIAYLLAGLILSGCGVAFKTLTLDDNLPKPKPFVGLGDFKSTSIYKNSFADGWTENNECYAVEQTSVSHTGDQALSMKWDRSGCDWIGFGIGWDGWQPKDLSRIMDRGAIEFYIRSIEGETNVPLIIFLLEDYGDTKCAAVFGSACLERYPIDEQWQKATMPLSWFSYEADGVDMTNIKQLIMEFQNQGSVIIDDMRIVEYQEPEAKPDNRIDKPSLVKLDLPATLFDDEFENVWGLGQHACRDFQITGKESFQGSKSVRLKWEDEESCDWRQFGISWTRWLAVDFSDHLDDAALDFWMKGDAADDALFAGIMAYNYASGKQAVSARHILEEKGGWKHVRIPVSELRSGDSSWPVDNVKQIFFEVQQSGEVYIDNIQLISAP